MSRRLPRRGETCGFSGVIRLSSCGLFKRLPGRSGSLGVLEPCVTGCVFEGDLPCFWLRCKALIFQTMIGMGKDTTVNLNKEFIQVDDRRDSRWFWRFASVAWVDDRYWGRFGHLSAWIAGNSLRFVPYQCCDEVERSVVQSVNCKDFRIPGSLHTICNRLGPFGRAFLLSVDPGGIDGGRALNNPNPAARRIGFSLLHLSLLSSVPHGFRFDDNDRAAGRIILLLGLQLFNPRVGTGTRWEWRTIRSFLWSNRPRDASHFGVQGHRLAGDGLFAR